MDEDRLESPGTRIGHECLTFIPADSKLRPLRDQIILEPLEPLDSKRLLATYFGRPIRGTILAVGPGVYPKRYNDRKGQRTRSWDSKSFRPTELQPGMVVELGGRSIGGYLFQRLWWGDRQVMVAREEDVCGVVKEAVGEVA